METSTANSLSTKPSHFPHNEIVNLKGLIAVGQLRTEADTDVTVVAMNDDLERNSK